MKNKTTGGGLLPYSFPIPKAYRNGKNTTRGALVAPSRPRGLPPVVSFSLLDEEAATMPELPQHPKDWPEPWASVYIDRVERLVLEGMIGELASAEIALEMRAEFAAAVRRKERAAEEGGS